MYEISEEDMERYRAAVRRFYDVYKPIAKRYKLAMASHFSVYDNGWIKIYMGEGTRRKQVVKVEEEDDADCYDRATDALISWINSRKAHQKQEETHL